jgi:dGTPase
MQNPLSDRLYHSRVKPRKPDLRGDYFRDQTAVIHSTPFRRLKHKTQVFLAPFGDHYRTRLTHTLEVSQIARTIAKALRLNEDLTEAIALGHDLGHTPFGHAGEQMLNELLPGGFSHSEQSLRVVEKLEYDGKGLNLTFEVRDGIAKHSKGRGEILDGDLTDLPMTLEGQIVRVSDIIGYVNHDVDDALRAEVISEADIPASLVKILGKWHANRIDRMVMDVVEASLAMNLERIALSPRIKRAVVELRDFLYEKVYFGTRALEEHAKVKKIMVDLFRYVLAHPADYVKDYPKGDPLEVRAGDFIAGMTDQYALALYEKLFLKTMGLD